MVETFSRILFFFIELFARQDVTLNTLLLLVPRFFNMLIFRRMIIVTFIVNSPAAVTTGNRFIPFALTALFPLLFITLNGTGTNIAIRISAGNSKFVVGRGDRELTVLRHLSLYATGTRLFKGSLRITAGG